MAVPANRVGRETVRVHKRFRASVLGDLCFGGLHLMFLLGALVLLAYLLRNGLQTNSYLIWIIWIAIGANVLIDLGGLWVSVGTLPYHALLTRLVEENISVAAMTITIRIEKIFNEDIEIEIKKADLRFLGENSGPPAITLEHFKSESLAEKIAPGTQVTVFGARESKGPVVVETENGFLWPTYHGRAKNGGSTTRRVVPNHSLSQKA